MSKDCPAGNTAHSSERAQQESFIQWETIGRKRTIYSNSQTYRGLMLIAAFASFRNVTDGGNGCPGAAVRRQEEDPVGFARLRC